MSWTVLFAVVAALALAVSRIFARRSEAIRSSAALDERERARRTGSDRARLQYPHIDLTRCIGCGSCVRACPEEGVLDLLHGQAVVVHGARCVGHARCAAECPTNAIAVTLGDLRERADIPVLGAHFESNRVRGLFLAGEVTGYALVRTAIAHGVEVADEVARRTVNAPAAALPRRVTSTRGGGVATLVAPEREAVLDLLIVGGGPAGLACSLRAEELGLAYLTLEQEQLGGTVAKYPRRKLVMTQPIDLPLHGRLDRSTYSKEDLVELWADIAARHGLRILTGEELVRVEQFPDGILRAHTRAGSIYDARNVCLALGRRGTPRKLGVPGEELSKVSYSLLDAHGYRDRRILVVGGGDSAVEAAIALSEQPGNVVHVSYRKSEFFRLKSRNDARIRTAIERGAVQVVFDSEVVAIGDDRVRLRLADGSLHDVANDEVFVFAGGTPPFQILEASGVSFDPSERPAAVPLAERGSGIFPALVAALLLAVIVLGWSLLHRDYYATELVSRPVHPDHARLAPSGSIGLACGIAAAACIAANLAYLARRSLPSAERLGSLQAWMTSHVVTGILALLLVVVHSAMAPKHTVGGHAFIGIALLVVTGAIGRYFYAFVPRAANGRELALDDVRTELAALSSEWDAGRGTFGERLRAEIDAITAEAHWRRTFFGRVYALLAARGRMSERIVKLRSIARAEGVAPTQIEGLIDLARRAQRTALMAAHYEDLRALLASWRWFHRWFALAMVVLVVLHVVVALRYGSLMS